MGRVNYLLRGEGESQHKYTRSNLPRPSSAVTPPPSPRCRVNVAELQGVHGTWPRAVLAGAAPGDRPLTGRRQHISRGPRPLDLDPWIHPAPEPAKHHRQASRGDTSPPWMIPQGCIAGAHPQVILLPSTRLQPQMQLSCRHRPWSGPTAN